MSLLPVSLLHPYSGFVAAIVQPEKLLLLTPISKSLSASVFRPFGSSSSGSSVSAPPTCMLEWGSGGVKTGSMCVKPLRCGFGLKYFGFLHIRGCFYLFLFLRGART